MPGGARRGRPRAHFLAGARAALPPELAPDPQGSRDLRRIRHPRGRLPDRCAQAAPGLDPGSRPGPPGGDRRGRPARIGSRGLRRFPVRRLPHRRPVRQRPRPDRFEKPGGSARPRRPPDVGGGRAGGDRDCRDCRSGIRRFRGRPSVLGSRTEGSPEFRAGSPRPSCRRLSQERRPEDQPRNSFLLHRPSRTASRKAQRRNECRPSRSRCPR